MSEQIKHGWKLALAHLPMASYKVPGQVEIHIVLAQVAPGMYGPNLVKLGEHYSCKDMT